MKTEEYQWYILSSASGTSIRHTSPSAICSYLFSLPPESKINEFEMFAADVRIKILKNTTQIKTLTNLRDTLLPKLMSGEVRVLNELES
jgi:type I restriction enzyme S subunit